MLAEKQIEAVVDWSAVQRPGGVKAVAAVEAQMPLADHRRRITTLAQHRGNGWLSRFDQCAFGGVFHAMIAEWISSGQQAVSRGNADGAGGMGIGESQTLAGQTIDVRRGDLRL